MPLSSARAIARTKRRRLVMVEPEPGPDRAVFVDASSGPAALWGRAYDPAPTAVDELAAREFAATAIAAVDALAGVRHGAIDVVGDGILAVLVRRLASGRGGIGPTAIIDTSGSPAAVRDALRRSDPLGTVVLAAPPTHSTVELATYTDLHVRGATVVGVAWRDDPPDEAVVPALVALALDQLAYVTLDAPFPPAPWYRLVT